MKDELQIIPAESFIESLSLAFNSLKSACSKLNDTFNALGKEDLESKSLLNLDSENAAYFELDTRLRKIDQSKKITIMQFTESFDNGGSVKAVPLKINKPNSLRFSGQAREFAPFKRDFLVIVVPNRDDAQIGIHLKQAIPKKLSLIHI